MSLRANFPQFQVRSHNKDFNSRAGKSVSHKEWIAVCICEAEVSSKPPGDWRLAEAEYRAWLDNNYLNVRIVGGERCQWLREIGAGVGN